MTYIHTCMYMYVHTSTHIYIILAAWAAGLDFTSGSKQQLVIGAWCMYYSHNLKILHFLYQVGQTAIIAPIPCVTDVKLTGDKFY